MNTFLRWCLSLITGLALAGCTAESPTCADDGKVDVNIRIHTSDASTATRDASAATWDDAQATRGEGMRRCFVVIVQDGRIKALLKSAEYDTEQSLVDRLATRLAQGATTFYAFANMRPRDVGLNDTTDYSDGSTPLPHGFEQQYHTVKGNTDDVTSFKEGIPMSNKQTLTITEQTQEVDLEVIRMVAKVRLKITNDTPEDITIKGISLSDITANEDSNLYLLPGADNGQSVEPHINPTAPKENLTIALKEPVTVKALTKTPTGIDFYVNESEATNPKYFVINIETTQTTESHRVALMKWNTIARNDCLVIPIKLNDYRITFDVEQFTPIGVLPSVTNDKDMLTVRMRGYGEFHMRPHLVRLSDGKELTPGTDAADGWLFAGWTTLEMSPSGADGTSIYDQAPHPDYTKRMIEGVLGNRPGYAIHQMLLKVSGADYEIPYKVQIIKE